jgi:hypothetical protein
MKTLIALMLLLAPLAAVAQVDKDATAKIERVMQERDAKLKGYYQQDLSKAKTPADINAVQQRYAPVFEEKVIGTDPALSAEQRVKLRKQNLYGNTERVSETEAEVSGTTIKDWCDDAARDHAVESFRGKDTKAMDMMFDSRRKALKAAADGKGLPEGCKPD